MHALHLDGWAASIAKVVLGVVAVAVVFFIGNVVVGALDPATTNSSYRVYSNADSATPGSPLAATNTAPTLPAAGAAFRVRMGISTRSDAANFTAVTVGASTACAISAGAAYCSGNNAQGALGNGGTTSTNTFGPVSTTTGMNGTLSAISINQLSSNQTACAIQSGQLFCWGSNAFQQLGVGQSSTALPTSTTPMNVSTATAALTGKTVTAVGNGDGHTCAVANAAFYCWGTSGNGRLGTGGGNTPNPTAVVATGVLSGKTPSMVNAGSASSCGLASGQVYCWGANASGQLGNNSTTDSTTPVAVDTSGVLSGKTVVTISVGSAFACALTTEGKAYCWGSNTNGQLGNNGTTGSGALSSVPVAVDMTGVLAGKTLSTISSGLNHTCVIANDGYPYCWGANGGGDLGFGSQNGATYVTPQKVTNTGVLSGKTSTAMNVGNSNSCTVASSQLFCWGSNNTGILGLGNNTVTSSPAASVTTNIGISYPASTVSAKLQFAAKSAATCSVQTTGFADVSTTSAIAWKTNPSVSNGATITSSGNDPIVSGTTAYQTYQSAAGPFSNPTAITPGNTGLWDFSLVDNSNLVSTSYCIRIVRGDGSALDGYPNVAEIQTAPSPITLSIVDGGGATVASPSFGMTTTQVQTSCQSSTGTFGTSSQKIHLVNNSVTTGWNISIAATSGPTAAWKPVDNSSSYDFNDPSGSPAGCNSGSDGDGIAGQLTFNPATATTTAQSGCSNTGVSLGSSAGFNQGTIDSLTIASGSTAAATGCYWDFTGVGVSQQIPANQSANIYLISLTATVVAQ